MASIRARPRKDGITYAVLFNLNGKQTSVPCLTKARAEELRDLVNRFGPQRAMEIADIPKPKTAAPKSQMTVEQWCTHHIDHLTGVQQGTIDLYRMFVRIYIAPVLGSIPLGKLVEEDVADWVTFMTKMAGRRTGKPPSANTIRNAHAFLSGALAKAVPKHLAANPAAGRRLPESTTEGEDDDVRMLSRDEYDRLLASVTQPWRPLVEFLVASGCRWGEAVALKPADVNREANTVRVTKSWKHSASGGYTLGTPKTRRSRRTINVPKTVLDNLNYDHEWLFVNRVGGPVRYHTFRAHVWKPAAQRSKLDPEPRIHDLRHTYASWSLNAGGPIPVVSRQLGHESIQITVDIYGDIDRTVAAKAAEVMGQILAAPPRKAIEA